MSSLPTSETHAQRLEQVGAQLTTLLQRPDVAHRLRSAKSGDDWSALQTLGHTIELIPYWLHHCQTLITAAEPPQFGRTLDAPERLAGVERGATGNIEELLHALQTEIQNAARTIRNMSEADRAKRGFHNRRGEMTVGQVVDAFIVGHAEEHLAQIQTTLQ